MTLADSFRFSVTLRHNDRNYTIGICTNYVDIEIKKGKVWSYSRFETIPAAFDYLESLHSTPKALPPDALTALDALLRKAITENHVKLCHIISTIRDETDAQVRRIENFQLYPAKELQGDDRDERYH